MKLSILIFSSIALCVTGVASIPAKRELNVGPLGLRKFLEAVPTGTTSVPVSSATPSQGATSEKPSDVQVAELAPPLGFQSGLNLTGLDSVTAPSMIPCTCPPAQDVYITQLQLNVAAGFAVHNPTIQILFPTDNSTQSQSARITAALITVENIDGPEQGCPADSTTLLAQQEALQGGVKLLDL
ncbi:hypothetical protein NLI96_g9072 [Meripilus lineatus]|uniref:Phosphatidylglycerol/phosphatidylinositol transfer protein n=1 Tax=Meripilus lineatus TaxID=2056292 RepID=A0AAD5UWG5_9APHY|nr:hypothetical protein NLI96_g9072 [Physisporinus lineatus]